MFIPVPTIADNKAEVRSTAPNTSECSARLCAKTRVGQCFSADAPSLMWLRAHEIALPMGRNGLKT